MKAGLLALALVAPPAPSAAGQALAPSGKWAVEYADSLCLLSRDFGSGDAQVKLGIRPTRLGSFTQLVVVRPENVVKGGRGDAQVVLMPSGISAKASYTTRTPVKGIGRITIIGIKSAELANLASSTEIAITLGKSSTIRVLPKGIAKAMAALRTCEDDLLASWGVDPKKQAALIKRPDPIGSVGDFWPPDNYPSAARQAEEQGAVLVGYIVLANGRVANCRVLASSKSAALDKATCSTVVKLGRYRPAIGPDGKPTDAFETNRVTWTIE
ncbi:TonB family protein [Sphingomonas sp. UYAg733]